MTLNELGDESHDRARRKGFYEPCPSILERLALIHSEISEAAEETCRGRKELWFGPDGKPEGLGVELADASGEGQERAVAAGRGRPESRLGEHLHHRRAKLLEHCARAPRPVQHRAAERDVVGEDLRCGCEVALLEGGLDGGCCIGGHGVASLSLLPRHRG